MTIHHLGKFFEPRAIAVIGASERPGSVGSILFRNLSHSGFTGKVYPVNPKHEKIQGQICYPDVTRIKDKIDLAVITTPAQAVPEIIRQCADARVLNVIVISSGFREIGASGRELEEQIVAFSKQAGIRMIGPNCLGMMNAYANLNASFADQMIQPGHIALISQSGALFAAIIDWALDRNIGFSTMVSLGNCADVDFGDMLEYLAMDPRTHSILLYVEGIRNARHFLSGLRIAARVKPVIVIKAGRKEVGQRAITSHTGAMVGTDEVFAAALERAGALRVYTVEQLFTAANVLNADIKVKGRRLGIITNSGGPGVLAADYAEEKNIRLPALSSSAQEQLNQILPKNWSRNNPIDILGDAPVERYAAAVRICLADTDFDALLVMLTPLHMSNSIKIAQELIDTIKAQGSDKPVLACWLGGDSVKEARQLFSRHQIPSFASPESAIEAFSYLAQYQANQQLLLQAPEPLKLQEKLDVEGARLIIENALAENRKQLSMLEAKAVLAAFNIPVIPTYQAENANESLIAAESSGFPVVMKINSPDISHKKDVGGVILNIKNAREVRAHYQRLMERMRVHYPDVKLAGVTIEPMHKRPNGRELLVGIVQDASFGPAISFAAGGTLVELMQDRAIALPPLNTYLAKELIKKTRIAKWLDKFRDMPAVNFKALEHVLLRISDLACEIPEIKELDINPLVVDEQGVMAIDARIRIDYPEITGSDYPHMAIHPYPKHWIKSWQLADGSNIMIRPIRPEDAGMEQVFVKSLSKESRYFRFLQVIDELTPVMLARLTQIDYDREMAFIAVVTEDGTEKNIGVARYASQADKSQCDFAVVVADAWRNKGLGSKLMQTLMEHAKANGIRTMQGKILKQNHDMLDLARHLGFNLSADAQDAKLVNAVKNI